MTSRNVGFFTKSAEFYDGFVKYILVMHMHMQAVSLIAKKKYFVHQVSVRYLEGYFLIYAFINYLVQTYDITATSI